MTDIYLLIDGKQQGPYTEHQVRRSLEEGLIPADLPAWHEGLADWVQVETLVVDSEASTVESPDAIPSPALPADTVPVVSASGSTPASGRPRFKTYSMVAYLVGCSVVAAGVTIGAIRWVSHAHQSSFPAPEQSQVIDSNVGADGGVVSTSPANVPAQIDSTGGNQVANATSNDSSATPADIEEARAFIEKQFDKNSVYRQDKRSASVRINVDTGHLVMENVLGYDEVDCFLGALDADYVAVKSFGNTPTLILPAKNFKPIIKLKRGTQVESKEQVELSMVPEEDRVADAFRFLIRAYSPSKDANNTTGSTELRAELCDEIRTAMSTDNTIRECKVSYDKDTEALHYRLVVVGGPYMEVLIPIKEIDPQAMKWQKSGAGRSQLLFRTIEDKPAIRVFSKWGGLEGKDASGHWLTISFASEDEASQCFDTVTELCKELGWQPSKF